ncbi:MAG TPA: cytochrome c oxidase subunit 3 [Terracidiphilus sp.]
MPIAFSRAPAEVERKEPGIGGKPPVDRRPTGGGGGGGDDDYQHPRKGPRDRLQRIRLFVFFALAGDMMFFAALVVLFFARQAGMHLDPRSHEMIGDWRPIDLPPIVYLNTAVLILSSLTMEFGRRNIFREIDVLEEWLGLGRPALRRALPWIGATLALGTLFVIGQIVAWRQLTAQGFAFDRFSTPASYFFYVVTGLHAGHLVLGVLALVLCLTALRWFKRVESRQIAVDITSWYWHTLGAAWILLLAVLAVGQ